LYTEAGILPNDSLTARMTESLVLQAREDLEMARAAHIFVPGVSGEKIVCPGCFLPEILYQMECCDAAKCAECWHSGFLINKREKQLARCGDCHKIATEEAIRQVEKGAGEFEELVTLLRAELPMTAQCPVCSEVRVTQGRNVLFCRNGACNAMTCL
jgi:hypothetical protein